MTYLIHRGIEGLFEVFNPIGLRLGYVVASPLIDTSPPRLAATQTHHSFEHCCQPRAGEAGASAYEGLPSLPEFGCLGRMANHGGWDRPPALAGG